MAINRSGLNNVLWKNSALAILFPLLLASPGLARDTLVPIKEGISYQGDEEFIFLGWNDACSAALQHLQYPQVGEGLIGRPSDWRIGTLTILAGALQMQQNWAYESKNALNWDERRAARAIEDLVRGGYIQAGTIENIRDAPVAPRPGLEQILITTTAFQLGVIGQWPPSQYALKRIYYSPLGTCGIFLFEGKTVRERYRYKLMRILNPDVRRTRARAHVTNGILLYKGSDLYGAQQELEIASEMDSHYGLARYYHAVFLSALGRFDQALEELKVAIQLSPQYADRARQAFEFNSLRRDQRFQAILDLAP